MQNSMTAHSHHYDHLTPSTSTVLEPRKHIQTLEMCDLLSNSANKSMETQRSDLKTSKT